MKFMKRALVLAKKGMGHVHPNPMVGAVLVKNGTIIGEGYHEKYGGPHAEVNAIGQKKNLEDAILYVTLEPCCHQGKTPPCTERIIQSGIKKVMVSTLDPNPLVSGKGVKRLREAGVDVEVGLLEDESKRLNEIFNHFIVHHTPFVIMKYAMTLDGKISTLSGDAKWISNETSRRHSHYTRHGCSGIMVGVDTVINDNPRLNTRLENGVDPKVIILDSRGRTPMNSHVVKKGTLIATVAMPETLMKSYEEKGVEILVTKPKDGRVDLEQLMIALGERGMDSLLVEGGGQVHGSLLSENLVHKVQAYIAPKLIGEGKSPSSGAALEWMRQAKPLKEVTFTELEGDMLIEGYLEAKCLRES